MNNMHELWQLQNLKKKKKIQFNGRILNAKKNFIQVIYACSFHKKNVIQRIKMIIVRN